MVLFRNVSGFSISLAWLLIKYYEEYIKIHATAHKNTRGNTGNGIRATAAHFLDDP